MVREETAVVVRDLRENPAYRNGWEDGRFGLSYRLSGESSTGRETSAGENLGDDLARRAYYHGHREGQRIRQMLRGDAGLE